jgi:hypothetical protein
MTIGLWITAIIIGILGIIISISIGIGDYNWSGCIIGILITVLLVGIIIGGGHWYCNNTAGGARALKDQESNLNNGLMREITITAEDGREIFHYIGRCDIETNGNYILFEDEDGLRQMIYWGVQDTIIISELPEK